LLPSGKVPVIHSDQQALHVPLRRMVGVKTLKIAFGVLEHIQRGVRRTPGSRISKQEGVDIVFDQIVGVDGLITC